MLVWAVAVWSLERVIAMETDEDMSDVKDSA